ncbi:substrate-binding domain-containing protein [Sphaerotilus sp.]|uniref:helix-turn-helix transcriptional regulator n=1 Tax=Sphaerotilus sp. TaxID=2093942 RepID=UPI0025D015ED|nr:substrate-binding domain-containing protein [Sphaerotilus sp.]
MKTRGIHLQYTFGPPDQRGAEIQNPLFDLLNAVREHGSIQQAAKALGASYRHIWGSLKQWEEAMGESLVVWTQGQPARLTPFADRLLWAETRARTRMTPHIEALRAELERVLTEALDGSQHVLTLYASHDLALPHLREIASSDERLHIDLRFAGSIDALRALAEGRCLVAGFHVPRIRTAAPLFSRALKPLLKPGQHKLIGCTQRTQGLMVARGNPLGLHNLGDLAGSAARFVNRQEGSATRLLTDHLLQQAGVAPSAIATYFEPSEDSHLAVAAAIASGVGDVGMGIEAAAKAFGLDFVPIVAEDYFLVCLKDALEHPAVLRLRQVLQSPRWQAALQTLPGYERAAEIGDVLSLTRALPWWSLKGAKSAGVSVLRKQPGLSSAADPAG